MIGQCHRRHRAVEFRKFRDTIEAEVPLDRDVHLIVDNYATHQTALIRNWLAKRPRFHLHFTPTSASWLNLVERWFGMLTEQQLRRGVHQSSGALEAAIYRYLDLTNENPKPFIWTKTADQILAKVASFCRRTLDTSHYVPVGIPGPGEASRCSLEVRPDFQQQVRGPQPPRFHSTTVRVGLDCLWWRGRFRIPNGREVRQPGGLVPLYRAAVVPP